MCIFCFVYVLSKMLKLCSAEGSSFRYFCWGSPDWPICDAVVRLLFLRQQLGVWSVWFIRIVWCCQIVFLSAICYWGNIVVLGWMLSAVCCWGSIFWFSDVEQMVSLQWLKPSVSAFSLRSQVVVVRRALSKATSSMLSKCDLKQLWSHSSECLCLSGVTLVGGWPLKWRQTFWGVLCCQILWWGNIVIRSCQSCVSEATWLLSIFLKQHGMTLSDICLFVSVNSWWCQMFVSEALSLALISQLVYHNCLVPGFTDGAGFLFCDSVVKTENLNWIFLLDVSLLLRLTCGAWMLSAVCCWGSILVLLSTSGSFNLSVFRACKYFSGYSLHVCRFSCADAVSRLLLRQHLCENLF